MYIFSNVIARFLTLIFAALYALGGAPWSTLAELPQMPYPAELPVQEAFAALEPSQYTITRTAAPGQPKKGKLGEYAFFLNYDAHEYRLTLDKYYDIQRVTIRFAPGKAHDFLVQFAESELVWYNAKPLSREQNGDTVTLTVDECYRKYIRVQLSGPAASKDDVLDMQVVAAPTVVLPTVRRGPVTMGVARPVILPLPADVPGVAQAVSDLSGTWKLSLDPPGGFWRSAAAEGWRDAQVPAFTEVAAGELLPSQANDIREVAYKTAFVVPEDARGKRLFLRFESVQTTARVWVNGVLAGTHHGGYGTFDFDITAYAQPGAAATLVVGVARVPYDASFTLSRGPDTMGINGPVKLIIAGQTHLTRLAVDTQLRSHNKTAVLKLDSTVSLGGAQFAEARLSLTGPDGESVPLPKSVIKYSGAGDVKSDITVQHPKLWNAETPNLYTLRVELVADGEVVEAVTRRVGFREIEIENFFTKELRVNGQPVFLRGVDWTNLNPTGGLAFDYESDRKSLLLLKKANVNMIRTSHHPQYEAILELCDELGIYVESEAGPHLVTDGHVHEWIEKYHTLNDKKYAAWFLTQYAENVERARSHASVIIYSLGNESSFGKNQERGALYTRAIDPSRPIKFSWWGEYVQSCLTDFRSVHYDDPPLVPQKVAVVDEYAHLHTGGRRIESDPGLRGYYAHVIAAKADLLWKHYSTAGGAIWHSRDFLVFGP
ncbi:MAG: hypothetical protein FWF60_05805, partial [Oscillospiraceae bacterium]|nr:hypothetical protein [Oscillospiraceae bacterium]